MILLDGGFLEFLQNILSYIFNDVLAPLLTSVFIWAFNLVVKLLGEMLSDIWLNCLVYILKFINVLSTMFNTFAGTTDITYTDPETKTAESMTLIAAMFKLHDIERIFLLITAVGFLLACILSAYSVAKSIGDVATAEEKARPITTVLKDSLKAGLTFLLVPVLCISMQQFSATLMTSLTRAFEGNYIGQNGDSGQMMIDDVLFASFISDATDEETVEMFASTPHLYLKLDVVRENVDINEIDFLFAFISCGAIILIMGGAILMFVRRIFDLLVLYIVSPFFTATIPLDGGTKFKGWREKFVGKFFSCFGTIYMMDLFLLITPIVSSGSQIHLSGDAKQDSLLRIFFMIGAAWAVFNGQTVIGGLIGDTDMESAQKFRSMVKR